MNIKQEAVKGIIWSAIEGWGYQAISFIVFSVLARLLNPEAFGLVALASIFVAFVQLFLDQGLSQAIVQREKIEPEHLDTAFWTNLLISTALTLLSVFCADWIAGFFNQPQLAPVISWLSLLFFLSPFSSVQQTIFVRKLAFKTLAIRSLIAAIVSGTIGISMALFGYGVWSLVGQQLSRSFTQIFILWWISDWKPSFRFSKKHFRELFSFGINIIGINCLTFINQRSDDFLIGYFLGPTSLGYYSIAYRLLVIARDLLTGITAKVAMPTFARLQYEEERLKNAFYTATQVTSLIAFPCFLGMAVLSPELIQTLFGRQWLPSVPVMQILTFIGILHSVYYFNGTVMVAIGKPSWKFWTDCLSAVVNLIGFILVVRWGIVAVAAAYVIRGYLLSPIPLLIIKKLIRIELKIYFRKIASPIIASIGMAGTILYAKHYLSTWLNPYIALFVYIIIGLSIYSILITFIAPNLFRKVTDLARLAFQKA